MTMSRQIARQKTTKKDRETSAKIADLEDTVKQQNDTIEQQQETITSLQKQVAKQKRMNMKLYEILLATIMGLQVSPNSINDCFNVFQRMIKIIERGQQLSQTKIRNTRKKIEGKKEKIEVQTAQAKNKETRRKQLDNSNVPSSKQPDHVKKGTRKSKSEWKKAGQDKGHKGVSDNIKTDKTRHHKKEKCDGCGSKHVDNKRSRQKRTIDIQIIILHILHIGYFYNCRDCGASGDTFDSIPDILHNTMLCPILGVIATIMRKNGCSIRTITSTLQCLDPCISKKMVTGAIDTIADKLDKYVKKIERMNLKSKVIYMDETSMSLAAKLGWVWVLVGDYGTQFIISPERTKDFLEKTFKKYILIPLVSDGYVVYKLFNVRQRCWAHILRNAKDTMCDVHTVLMYKRLQKLLEIAKALQVDNPNHVDIYLKYRVDDLVQKTLSLAAEYKKLDNESCRKFGVHLANAADDLYTFVLYYGMEYTNNRAERAIRSMVLFRKVTQRIVSEESKRRVGNIFTCVTTWEQQGLNVYDTLLKVVRET